MKLLTIELVPRSAWGKNLRAVLSSADWDTVRRWCYKNANYRCECCGGVGDKHPVECHEIWSWDNVYDIQWLSGVMALCPTCHAVKHFGRALSVAADPEQTKLRLLSHIAQTNGWNEATVNQHLEDAIALFELRSDKNWTLDTDAWLSMFVHTVEPLRDYTPVYSLNPDKEEA